MKKYYRLSLLLCLLAITAWLAYSNGGRESLNNLSQLQQPSLMPQVAEVIKTDQVSKKAASAIHLNEVDSTKRPSQIQGWYWFVWAAQKPIQTQKGGGATAVLNKQLNGQPTPQQDKQQPTLPQFKVLGQMVNGQVRQVFMTVRGEDKWVNEGEMVDAYWKILHIAERQMSVLDLQTQQQHFVTW